MAELYTLMKRETLNEKTALVRGLYPWNWQFLASFDLDLLRPGGFCLGQSQREHTIADFCFDVFGVDGSGQAQGPHERTVREFADEVFTLIHLVFALNTDDILQDLNIQLIGLDPWNERRENVSFVFLPDVDPESLIAVLSPTARHAAMRIGLYIERHGLSPVL